MKNKINKIKPEELASNLKQFIGTDRYYRYSPLFPDFLLTDGTKYLAENANCFWLMDYIASHQVNPLIQGNQMLKQIQFWQLQVKDNKGKLWVEEDKDRVIFEEYIEYTDFPLSSFTLYVQQLFLSLEQDKKSWLCFLPSEY